MVVTFFRTPILDVVFSQQREAKSSGYATTYESIVSYLCALSVEEIVEESEAETSSSSGSSSYSSESDSESEGKPSENEKDVALHSQHESEEEDVIELEKEPPYVQVSFSQLVSHHDVRPIPRLGTSIPTSIYLQLDATYPRLLDPEVEKAEKAASGSAPAPPIRPPELNKDGTRITKKQKKEVCTWSCNAELV